MIKPVKYQKRLEGKSNAHLIAFNDDHDYVVKFFQPGFEKSLPNEWIGYCLARYLGLPIPYGQIVDIPQEFCLQTPELAQMTPVPFQFALQYIPNCFDGHQVVNISKLTNNQSQLAAIILFDYWLCNTDRTRKNILLQKETMDSYHLWAIDHAEIFGTYNWELSGLEKLPVDLMKSATHQIIASFIKDEICFSEQVELIQMIPILLLEEIVELIPDEWSVSREEKKAMVSVLLKRRKRILPEVMRKFIKKIYRPLQNYQ